MFSYYFDNTFALARGWSLTANVSGSTEGDMHTNRFGRNLFVMNASVGKTLLNKSLTVKISATDIFNTATTAAECRSAWCTNSGRAAAATRAHRQPKKK